MISFESTHAATRQPSSSRKIYINEVVDEINEIQLEPNAIFHVYYRSWRFLGLRLYNSHGSAKLRGPKYSQVL